MKMASIAAPVLQVCFIGSLAVLFSCLRFLEFVIDSFRLFFMKKFVVLIFVVAGLAFLSEPTARAGVHFAFGFPIPFPVFYGPGYYDPYPYYGYYPGYAYYGGYYGPYWRHRYYNGYYGRRYYGRYYGYGRGGNWHH
jgi:hypothetical protein